MKNIFLSFFVLITCLSCTKKPEKPKLSIGDFSKQATITKGVVEKILAEKDYKQMHEIAIAVESSRAVNCISIGEECNIYGQILNKIVSSTQTRLPNEEENVEIYKKIGELDQAIMTSQEKLVHDWKEYIKAHTDEEK